MGKIWKDFPTFVRSKEFGVEDGPAAMGNLFHGSTGSLCPAKLCPSDFTLPTDPTDPTAPKEGGRGRFGGVKVAELFGRNQ